MRHMYNILGFEHVRFRIFTLLEHLALNIYTTRFAYDRGDAILMTLREIRDV